MGLPHVRAIEFGPFLAMALITSTIAWGGPAQEPQRETAVSDEPMTISASSVGRFSKGRSWYLSVNSAGQAELTIATFPRRTRRRFEVPQHKLAELRQALNKERFFDLADEYGQMVPDSSTTTLTVSVGDRVKSVRLGFLMNWVHHDKAKLHEPSRAVTISLMIRDWFDDAEAADRRPYDRLVLNAAQG